MNWSYVGLVAAGVSEAATRLPSAPFCPAVFAGTVIVFLIGGAPIARGCGKYNLERLASTKRTDAPLSITEALKRRSATCSYGKQVDTLSTRSWFNGAIMWLSRNSRPVHESTLIAARLCDPGPRFR